MNEITFVGSTRFSVINFQSHNFFAFRGQGASIDDVRRFIFADDRLDERFRIFEALVLPCLAVLASRTSKFHHLLLISSDMPAKWQSRLHEICRGHEWLHIHHVPFDLSISKATKEFLKRFQNGRIFNFRLDDDDALASGFCDAVEAAAETLDDGSVLVFERGFRLRPLETGRFMLSSKRRASPSAGLGVLSSANRLIEVYSLGNHNKVAAVPIARNHPMWIRLMHSSNDSGDGVGHWWSWRHSIRSAAKAMQPWFVGLDLERALSSIAIEPLPS
ncbi:glycosyltransferase [Rhizobium sp. S96]|uniref:glycosyltransferase n=1 Tax=Rhizobium sp. S96 TaxID=3055140 RepID=UPI0025AAE918|nr:glycosyltransferase [Rhizobium sp. S96]MDM9618749.1 glycosyltransferase [Rhizobium sp. S96]